MKKSKISFTSISKNSKNFSKYVDSRLQDLVYLNGVSKMLLTTTVIKHFIAT